jgi:plastocyanin
MYFSNIVAGLIAIAAATVQAASFDVQVGPNSQLIFSPNSIVANVGDTVNFHFNPKVRDRVLLRSLALSFEALTVLRCLTKLQ